MTADQLYTELELLRTDYNVITQKLESKSQALHILNQSLKACRLEKDQFKHMAEEVTRRYQLLRKTVHDEVPHDNHMDNNVASLSNLSHKQLVSLLIESREANKALQHELSEMQSKFDESMGDIRLLRENFKSVLPTSSCCSSSSSSTTGLDQKHTENDKQHIVSVLEKLTAHIVDLEHELARCADERQEMVGERDVYRNRCDRLNNELNYILSGNDRKIVNIDALIMEKKALKYRLQTVEEENRLAMTTLAKYQKLKRRQSVDSATSCGDEASPTHLKSFTTKESFESVDSNSPIADGEVIRNMGK